MSVSAGSALFRVADIEPAAGSCRTLACEITGVITDPGIATGAVFAGVTALMALAYIRDAGETCRRERRRVLDERDAFRDFADNIEALDPVPVESSTANAGRPLTEHYQTIGPGNATDITLHRVLSIYKETVMSVPHYETEYGETVPESLAAELGPDTATSLAANGTLSPPAKHSLVRRSCKVADSRASLADAIETELDALSDTNTNLAGIDRRRRRLVDHLAGINGSDAGAAIDVWERLDDLEAEAEAVAADRQQSLREPPMQVNPTIDVSNEMAFYDYLYGATDGLQHPVLSQVADLIATIREDRHRVAGRIANER